MPNIITWFSGLNSTLQALGGTLFTYLMTAAGAGLVFFFKTLNRKVLDAMLICSWLMIAASLVIARRLFPGAARCHRSCSPAGFLLGGFLRGVDLVLPHLHPGLQMSEAEGIKTHWRKTILLVLAITLHNFPEGLAVGVAFGAVAAGLPEATLAGAVALALGIGIQNFPEGAAVSFPLRENIRAKAFFTDSFPAVLSPASWCAALSSRHPPWARHCRRHDFAVAEEAPRRSEGNSQFLWVMAGIMMLLDVGWLVNAKVTLLKGAVFSITGLDSVC